LCNIVAKREQDKLLSVTASYTLVQWEVSGPRCYEKNNKQCSQVITVKQH
jgi:hypothetical protein